MGLCTNRHPLYQNYPTVTTLNDSFESFLVGSKNCHVNNSYAHNMVTSSQQMFSQKVSHHAHPLLNSGPNTRYFAENIADCTSESVYCAGIDYEKENRADYHILASQSQPFLVICFHHAVMVIPENYHESFQLTH